MIPGAWIRISEPPWNSSTNLDTMSAYCYEMIIFTIADTIDINEMISDPRPNYMLDVAIDTIIIL